MKTTIASLAICVMLVLGLSLEAKDNKISVTKNGVTVTLVGPNSCSVDDMVTVTVEIKSKTGGGGVAGYTYNVTLKEKDLFLDDKIGTKKIVGPNEPGAWKKSVKFKFKPAKFEIGKKLELYFIVKRKVASVLPGLLKITNKKNPLKLKCGN